jgi:hypothetical protein
MRKEFADFDAKLILIYIKEAHPVGAWRIGEEENHVK